MSAQEAALETPELCEMLMVSSPFCMHACLQASLGRVLPPESLFKSNQTRGDQSRTRYIYKLCWTAGEQGRHPLTTHPTMSLSQLGLTFLPDKKIQLLGKHPSPLKSNPTLLSPVEPFVEPFEPCNRAHLQDTTQTFSHTHTTHNKGPAAATHTYIDELAFSPADCRQPTSGPSLP